MNCDPIRMGAEAATANAAVDGFVIGSSIEMPRGIRINNVVSLGLLKASEVRYGEFSLDHERVSSKHVGLAYVKRVEGTNTGSVIIAE